MNENFLLKSELSQQIYDVVKDLPIVDFHNHLPVKDIADNKIYSDFTELWIATDPYKHRAMRILGVDEFYITGQASNYEKFQKWAECVPMLIGNPLYDWVTMELKQVFDIDIPLNHTTCDEIWNKVNTLLAQPDYTTENILKRFNIAHSAPCCTLCDDVSFFKNSENYAPSLRGDDILSPTPALIGKLTEIVGFPIITIEDYLAAIKARLDVFHVAGCRFSDHALDDGFCFKTDCTDVQKQFTFAICGETYDKPLLQSYILVELASMYAALNWTMQLHIGAHRRTSDRLLKIAGPAGGYAATGCCDFAGIIDLLNACENTSGGLPKTVLFPLNAADSAAMAIISGSFSKDGVKALVQEGPAWWWCDHNLGIRKVLDNIASYSVLSTFIGMTTDSRCLLSFVRHDYFRRALSDWLADKVIAKHFPEDIQLLKTIAQKICYYNAAERIG